MDSIMASYFALFEVINQSFGKKKAVFIGVVLGTVSISFSFFTLNSPIQFTCYGCMQIMYVYHIICV